MKKAIPYYRVSTARQGQSGLGLDVQKTSVQQFASSNSFSLVHEFVEIETGKRADRPVLLQALEACKRENAVLLIAKLDRLARNVAFISKLMEANVDFIAVDNPYAGKLIVHIMAAFAEHERDQISQRTKAALGAAKKRGVILGSHGKYVLSQLNKIRAKQFALTMRPLIHALQQEGFSTTRTIAQELNNRNIPTYRNAGARWHASTVHRIMKLFMQDDPKQTANV